MKFSLWFLMYYIKCLDLKRSPPPKKNCNIKYIYVT
jgi:hypothetical protein